MKNWLKYSASVLYGAALVMVCTVGYAMADAASEGKASSVSEAISKGKATLSFRYRFEHVDQDGVEKQAKASTLRTRLGLESAE